MSFTDFAEAATLNHWFNGIATPSPTSVWVALYTSAPSDDGTGGTEVVGTFGYNRIATTGNFTVASGPGTATNIAGIPFDQAIGGGWGTVVAGACFDAIAGNMFAIGAISPGIAILENEVFEIGPGEMVWTLI